MSKSRANPTLITGDFLAILAVSMIGFLTHRESPFTPRLFTTLLPLLLAWGLQAPWFGLYDARIYRSPKLVWRAGLALLLAAPLAALLRSYMLGQALVVPVFVVALGISGAVGIVLWRLLYTWLSGRALQNG